MAHSRLATHPSLLPPPTFGRRPFLLRSMSFNPRSNRDRESSRSSCSRRDDGIDDQPEYSDSTRLENRLSSSSQTTSRRRQNYDDERSAILPLKPKANMGYASTGTSGYRNDHSYKAPRRTADNTSHNSGNTWWTGPDQGSYKLEKASPKIFTHHAELGRREDSWRRPPTEPRAMRTNRDNAVATNAQQQPASNPARLRPGRELVHLDSFSTHSYSPPTFDSSPFNFASVPSAAFTTAPEPPRGSSGPSAEYILQATVPSEELPLSSAPRKLLILDLNGTLVVRDKGRTYPRPYMPTLRDFLLDRRTQEWLDVMVWSSAQHKNVDKMVERCFFSVQMLGRLMGQPIEGMLNGEADVSAKQASPKGKKREFTPKDSNAKEREEENPSKPPLWKGKLLEVWARDTLGLSQADYFRKAPTTKDLTNIWHHLSNPSLASLYPERSRSHGPETTFLLDDSPRKVRLQPYNHICLLEYDLDLLYYDLKSLEALVRKRAEEERSSEKQYSQNENRKGHEGWDAYEDEFQAREQYDDRQTQPHLEELHCDRFDETLLAVIGVISSLRPQSNVAGWIKSGGLWAGKEPPTVSLGDFLKLKDGRRSPTDGEVDEMISEAEEEGLLDVGGDWKKRKEERIVIPGNDGLTLPSHSPSRSKSKATFPLPSSHAAPRPNTNTTKEYFSTDTRGYEYDPRMPPPAQLKANRGWASRPQILDPHERSQFNSTSSASHTGPSSSSMSSKSKYALASKPAKTGFKVKVDPKLAKLPSHIRVIHERAASAQRMAERARKKGEVYHDDGTYARPKIPMWFDDEETVASWVEKGRAVLKEMDIPERHGLAGLDVEI